MGIKSDFKHFLASNKLDNKDIRDPRPVHRSEYHGPESREVSTLAFISTRDPWDRPGTQFARPRLWSF